MPTLNDRPPVIAVINSTPDIVERLRVTFEHAGFVVVRHARPRCRARSPVALSSAIDLAVPDRNRHDHPVCLVHLHALERRLRRAAGLRDDGPMVLAEAS